MFGAMSLQKILIVAAIVVAVWYGFRLVGRLAAERRALQKAGRKHGRRVRETAAVEDMVRCRLCGDYVPASGALTCDRLGCPNR